MRMDSNTQTGWVQSRPYTAMLRQYQTAADKLLHRLKELKAELTQMQQHKRGTLDSAQAQQQLEQRIQLLRMEYVDLTDTIHEIGSYAAQEVQ